MGQKCFANSTRPRQVYSNKHLNSYFSQKIKQNGKVFLLVLCPTEDEEKDLPNYVIGYTKYGWLSNLVLRHYEKGKQKQTSSEVTQNQTSQI